MPRKENRRDSQAAVPRLIIDGYNFLYAVGFGQIGSPTAKLLLARDELLQFLIRYLPDSERMATVVAFDAKRAPYGADATREVAGMSIRFAVQYMDADELIKELIRENPTPRRLLVVSSDHSIQVAARRRLANVMDSEAWYEQVRSRRAAPYSECSIAPTDEVQQHIRKPHRKRAKSSRSSDREELDAAKPCPTPEGSSPFPPGYAGGVTDEEHHANPFPPGYGEDIGEHDDLNIPPRPQGRRRRR